MGLQKVRHDSATEYKGLGVYFDDIIVTSLHVHYRESFLRTSNTTHILAGELNSVTVLCGILQLTRTQREKVRMTGWDQL